MQRPAGREKNPEVRKVGRIPAPVWQRNVADELRLREARQLLHCGKKP